jgi:hypothetical protein
VVVYRDGEMHEFHSLDDRPPAGIEASTDHAVAYLRGETEELVLDGRAARRVLVALLAALDSAAAGRPIDIPG